MQLRTVIFGVLFVTALWALWVTRQVWAAAFLGVLLAVCVHALAKPLARGNFVSPWFASLVVIALILTALVTVGFFVGPPRATQVDQIITQLPASVEDARKWVESQRWGPAVLNSFGSVRSLTGSAGDMLSQVAGMFALTLTNFGLALVALAVMVFVAVDPGIYQRGVWWLTPPEHEQRVRSVMDDIAVALRWWMVGQLTSMAIVGVLTALGMWAIGMPSPLALGVIAGLFSFVPNIGPIASSVPGLLLAVPMGPWMVLWVASVYVVAQLIESNAVTPMVQQYVVSVPGAMLIVVQVVLGTLAGAWGLLIATPLMVTVMVLVQRLYVREELGKPVEVAGSNHGGEE